MADVFTLQSHEIASHWNLIEPFLRRIKKSDWTCEEVKAELEAARAQLWGFHAEAHVIGILITKLEETSAGLRGLLWIAAGEPLEAGLQIYRAHIEPWLKAKGCKYAQILGRKGWARVLPDYENVGVVLIKEFVSG